MFAILRDRRRAFRDGDLPRAGKSHHAKRWKSCAERMATSEPIGPMTTPAVWKPGVISRAADNVVSAPFTVLDFDEVDGIKPTNPSELRRHMLDSLGVIRWLKEGMHWQLSAILWIGRKSLHAWFHTLR